MNGKLGVELIDDDGDGQPDRIILTLKLGTAALGAIASGVAAYFLI